jgi:hypothetical protein
MSKNRAGKEIAQLTCARLAVMPDTKLWPFIQIASEISSVIKIFLQNVPKNKLGKQWKAIKEA